MNTETFDWLTALFAAISAVFWVLSARVRFDFGYDNNAILNAAMKKAGRLSVIAAILSAIAAGLPAAKVVLLHFKLIVMSV